MTLEEKVGQMLMVGFHGLEAPDYLLEWLRAGRIGGVILFARNVKNPDQLARLTKSLHDAARFSLLIGIDQEGGTVARLRQGFSESPGAMALSAAQDGPAWAEKANRVLAIELRAVGINWNFSPVVDIAYNPVNPSVGARSFGSDRMRVAEMGVATMRGLQKAGVAACAKHFPGLGSTEIDTHLALPNLDTSLDELLRQDIQPFRAVAQAGIASIMTTHTIFSALDAKLPVTLSPVIIQHLLRESLNFNGVISSDCMEMKAIADHFSPAETSVLGARAGLDLILFSHTRAMQEAAYEGLLAAAQRGEIPNIDAANERIAAMKKAFPAEAPDISQIRQPENLQVMLAAARAGVVLIQGGNLQPITDGTGLVEFTSQFESGIQEVGGLTGFATQLKLFLPQLPVVILDVPPYPADLDQAAESLARTASTLIIATRNAYLDPAEIEMVQRLSSLAKKVILVCLRNPYDEEFVSDRATILCTCGDSMPSLQAAAEAVNGVFKPTGKLPVPARLNEYHVQSN